MAIEETIFAAVGPMVGGRCYPDKAPQGSLKPYVTWQQVGGATEDPIDGSEPGLENSRIQLNVWANTRIEANALMRAIAALLRPNPIAGRPIGALVAALDDAQELRGARQDFSIWW